MTFREQIPVGRTDLSPSDVYEVVQTMGAQYKGNRYHLLQARGRCGSCNAASASRAAAGGLVVLLLGGAEHACVQGSVGTGAMSVAAAAAAATAVGAACSCATWRCAVGIPSATLLQ